MAILVGNNTSETTNKGLTNGVVRLKATAFVAVADGTATSAFVKVIDWADEITSRAKVVVWNSGGTQIGISDPITVPITTAAFVSAAFSSPFAITNGASYFLGVIVQSGTVDWYHSSSTFACTDSGGTYTYASPGGALTTGSTAIIPVGDVGHQPEGHGRRWWQGDEEHTLESTGREHRDGLEDAQLI
jgi:hypothetical protein